MDGGPALGGPDGGPDPESKPVPGGPIGMDELLSLLSPTSGCGLSNPLEGGGAGLPGSLLVSRRRPAGQMGSDMITHNQRSILIET